MIRIKGRLAESRGASDAALLRSLEDLEIALQRAPESVRLWCLRGDLIQLASESSGFRLGDAERSYRQALAIDPHSAEAHVELGFFLDAVQDDPAAAEPYFRQAIACGGGPQAFVGLARVLAQLGRPHEALLFLDDPAIVGDPTVAHLRGEIEEGLWSPS